jgi:hypothetical protein
MQKVVACSRRQGGQRTQTAGKKKARIEPMRAHRETNNRDA